MSVRLKTIVGIAIIEGLLLVLLVFSAQRYLRESNEQQFMHRASTTADLFAVAASDAVIATDLALLENLVTKVLDNPDLVYARVRGQENVVLAEAGEKAALAETFRFDSRFNDISDSRFDIASPITVAGMNFGQIELGFNSAAITSLLAESRSTLISIALVEMILVALFSYLLGTYLTRQLTHLKTGATEISQGNYGVIIPERGNDELSHTASAFNHMSRELKSSETRRSAYQQSPIHAIISTDANGTIIEANPAAGIMLLTDYETLVGQQITVEFNILDKGQSLEKLEQQSTLPSRMLSRLLVNQVRRTDGTEFTCEWQLTRVEAGEETLFVIYASNIDARKEAQDALIQARLNAEAANEAKSLFLANMTHELRTPLQGILGFSELGFKRRATLTPEKTEKYFGVIKSSASTLLSLVDNLLDLTKLQSGKMSFDYNSTDLSQTLNAVISEFSDSTALRDISINQIEPGEVICEHDSDRVSQVFRNLFSNAIKFSPNNANIDVRLTRSGEIARFSIRDSGPGVPPAELEHIFGQFSQSTVTATGAGGTGLGLPLCREILTLHGGRIWAEVPANGGSEFYFELPAKRIGIPDDGPIAAVINHDEHSAHRSDKTKKIDRAA